MASQAEVDLIISTANALPQLERDLERIVRTAEADADAVELQALLDADDSLAELIRDLDSVIADAELAADPVQLEARLDQLASLTELQDDLSDVIHDAELRADEIRLDAELDADLARLDADMAQLVRELEASAPEVDIEVDVDREGRGSRAISALGRAFTSALPAIGKGAGAIGAAGLAAGAAVPLVAGLAAAVEAVAPASAVAVSGLLAVQLAAGTVKLAMIGVEDAVTAAFDPEASPEDLAKAMERLAPNARAFVTQLRSMRDGFREFQQDVQDDFFDGFDDALISLSTNVIPQFQTAIRSTATTLNQMVLGAAAAAIELGANGTLSRALLHATEGLADLRAVPGQVVTALGQLGAAAGPSFERITQAAAKAGDGISKRLTKAFESGRLEKAIDNAVDAIAQLGRIAGNVFHGIGNILNTVTQDGQGLFTIMEKVTQSFLKVTQSKGFQDALLALSKVAGTLVDEGLKLLVQVLEALGPIFTKLGPPVEKLIQLLGGSLGKIIEKLAPVLESAADAFGKFIPVLEPFINLATEILVAILPGLIPLFQTLGRIFEVITPFVTKLAENIGVQLLPFLRKLSEDVLPRVLPLFADLAEKIFPKLTDVLTELSPFLVKIGEDLGELLVKLVPLIEAWIRLQFNLAEKLMPILEPLARLILLLVEGALSLLHSQLVNFIIPALEILTLLLEGKFSEAWAKAKEVVRDMAEKAVRFIQGFVDGSSNSINKLAAIIAEKFLQMARDMGERIRTGIEGVLRDFASLPGRIAASLGDTGQTLVRAGQDFVLGFVRGIEGQIRSAAEAAARMAQSAVNAAKDFLGIQSPSRLMMAVGGDTIEGFRLGIAGGIPDLRSELQGIAALAPSFALPGGQTLQLPQAGDMRPTVQVFLGNERLDGHFDARIAQSNAARDRLAITGVRR